MTDRTPTARIGSTSFDAVTAELRGSGEAAVLRPQTARVLAILIERRGELVGRGELMDLVWKDTHVTEDSLVQCISEIRRALGPEDGRFLKTVPKQGYLLEVDDTAGTPPSRRSPKILVAVASLLVAAAVAIAALWPAGHPAPHPVVAVLPFQNIGDDPAQIYLSDGMANDLITDLSGISSLTVISRTSSFSFRDQALDVRRIGSDLGASHVIEGSVQRAGDRLRITAQLVDTKTGTQVWADRFDRDAAQIFELQDEVSSRIIAALEVTLTASETERLLRQSTTSPDAYDLYLRAQQQISFFDARSNARAQELLEDATHLDPSFAAGYALLAQAYSLAIENGWNGATGSKEEIDRAVATAQRGIALDPQLPHAYWSLARVYSRGYYGDPDAAQAALEKSVELDANFSDGLMGIASNQIKLGHAELALANIEKALRLNPHAPYWYHFTLGQAQYFMTNFEAAAESFRKAIDQNPNVGWPHRWLVAAAGQLGRTEDAEWEMVEIEALGQPLTIETFIPLMAIDDQGYRNLLLEGLRKAGVPES